MLKLSDKYWLRIGKSRKKPSSHNCMEPSITSLSDIQILALCDSELSAQAQAQLSELLEKQRENQLQPFEVSQLENLLQCYRQGLVRKAEALKVAVERGLRPALHEL